MISIFGLPLSSSSTIRSTRFTVPGWRIYRFIGSTAFSRHVPLIIGIRREDPLRIWERRAPLTPSDVKEILDSAKSAYEAYNRRARGHNQLAQVNGALHRSLSKASIHSLSDPLDSHPEPKSTYRPNLEPASPLLLPFPLEIHIQPSAKRIFSDSAYAKAGAKVTEDLNDAHVLIGIKEVGVEEVLCSDVSSPGSVKGKVVRTYLMFSHTTKGQDYNMPLLDRFLESESKSSSPPTLIDYELLTSSSSGKRTLAFGFHAGLAGTLFSLHTLGEYFLQEYGMRTPWLSTPLPHLPIPADSSFPPLRSAPQLDAPLPSVDELRKILRDVVGGLITSSNHGTGMKIGPCIIGVTGSGNVSRGCLSMLSELPHQFVSVDQLPDLVLRKELNAPLDRIYVVHIKPEDYLVRKDSMLPPSTFFSSYSRSDYYLSPSSYISLFSSKIAPYLTLLLNGAGWAPGYPRMIDSNGLHKVIGKAREIGEGRFAVVGDISCDPFGGLEFVTHATTLSAPFYRMEVTISPSGDPKPTASSTSDNGSISNASHPLYIQSVDILPASIPIDASIHFSNGLRKYLWGIIKRYALEHEVTTADGIGKADASKLNKAVGITRLETEDVESALQRATIASQGRLAGRFAEEGFLGTKVRAYRDKLQEAGRSRRFSSSSSPSSTSLPISSTSSSPWSSSLPLPPKHSNQPKRILILGSGMVAGPAVRWIIQRIVQKKDVELVVAGKERKEMEKLEKLARVSGSGDIGDAAVTFLQVDVGNPAEQGEVKKLVGEADVVISLLPASLHPVLANICINQHTHLVTASYISNEMRNLDKAAQEENVLLLNEIGLDPGIDHVSAISMMERLKEEGKEVKSFVSFCGGLPEPELLRYPENRKESGEIRAGGSVGYPPAGPLLYKFSWSPRGVLTAVLNGARYKIGGEVVTVPGVGFPSPDSTAVAGPNDTRISLAENGILSQRNIFPEIEFGDCKHDEELLKLNGMLEGLPNRDSLPYAEMYGLPEDARTVLRGTLRFRGFSALMSRFRQEGFLDMDRTIDLEPVSLAYSSPSSSKPKAPLLVSYDENYLDRTAKAKYLEHLWRGVIDQIRARPSSPSAKVDPLAKPIAWLLSADTGTPPAAQDNTSREWIGLPPLPSFPTTPLDLFTLLLSHKLQYGNREKDMVVLVHEVVTSNGSTDALGMAMIGEHRTKGNYNLTRIEEIHTSSLVVYGSYSQPSTADQEEWLFESAMARSVGIPVAIAALAVLDGAVGPVCTSSSNTQPGAYPMTIPIRGVHGPGHISIRDRVLEGMREAGIGVKEGVRRVRVQGEKGGLEHRLVRTAQRNRRKRALKSGQRELK